MSPQDLCGDIKGVLGVFLIIIVTARSFKIAKIHQDHLIKEKMDVWRVFSFNLRKTEAQTKQNDHLILLLKESSGLFNLTFSEKLSLHTVRLPVFSVGLERAKDKKEARLKSVEDEPDNPSDPIIPADALI